MGQLVVRSGVPLRGCTRVPGDRSITHRALLLGALAEGVSLIRDFLPLGDCLTTLACLRALGVDVRVYDETTVTVQGCGLRGLRKPDAQLGCGNSSTTMQLLAGILAGQPFRSTLTGASQLLRRSMRRVAEPLRRMGAKIDTIDGHGPITIRGRRLHGCDDALPVASAQVKSALLLAGLYAGGVTIIRQPEPACDHTERMLDAMAAAIQTRDLDIILYPCSSLSSLSIRIPGDLSSAAFPLVAAALVPGSEVTIEGVGINPTRTGVLDVLSAMGAELIVDGEREQGNEMVGDVTVRASDLRGVEVGGDTVVRMIDELPVLAVAATQAYGTTVVHDAAELRVGETDPIAAVASELQKLGAPIELLPDGFLVEGPTPLQGGLVESHGDHRVAMALAVAGLVARGETVIENADCMAGSFPGFASMIKRLTTDSGIESGR